MDGSSSDGAATAFLGAFFLVYVLVVLAIVAVTIWIFWRILSRAGFNGALAFLVLIPGVGALIPLLMLAFGRWPIEDQLAALQAAQPAMGHAPNPYAGPPATQ